MDQPLIGLIHQDHGDPPLNLSSDEDPLSYLTYGSQKASCGRHEEGPALGCATGIVIKFISVRTKCERLLKIKEKISKNLIEIEGPKGINTKIKEDIKRGNW